MTDNTSTKTELATNAQQEYIASLWKRKDVNKLQDMQSYREQYITGTLEKRTASRLIDLLFVLPKRPEGVHVPSETEKALDRIPKSFYAIPAEMVEDFLPSINLHGNDLLFIEVKMLPKTYRRPQGMKVMRRLHGNVGGFSRSRIADADVRALVSQIETDPVRFARLFGEHYGVCGRCAAKLTDHVSRRTQFGPECRKVMGINA